MRRFRPVKKHDVELVLSTPFQRIDKRTRIKKLMSITQQRGWAVTLLCWDRNRDTTPLDSFPNLQETEVLLRGGVSPAWWLRLHYLFWMVRLTSYFLRKPPSSPVYCLGFECAFPAFLASRVRSMSYLFDDADRFSLIVNLPRPFHRLLRFFEKKTSEHSLVHIVPGLARYEFRNAQQVVLRNTPSRQALADSQRMSPTRPDAELVIYVNGWLGEVRGLPIINSLADRLLQVEASVKFVAAGRLDSEVGEAFVRKENVTYLGEISNNEALSWYRVVDLVFTYYDPAVRINRFAESNKWGDAIHFGVPPIVNNEVVEAVIDLAKHPAKRRLLATNLAALRQQMVYFDDGLSDILDRHYHH